MNIFVYLKNEQMKNILIKKKYKRKLHKKEVVKYIYSTITNSST